MQRIVIRYGFSLARPKLHIYDKGGRHTMSGIRATVYGATGFSGVHIGGMLGRIGSELIFPNCHVY